MARGLADFGALSAKSALGGMADVGELAARLGGLSRYDRLGDVVFFEDFDGDLGAWEVEKDGTLSSVDISSLRKVSGDFSCKLTGGSDGDGYAGIKGRFPVPFSVVYGIEIAWTLHADMDYAIIQADVFTGVYKVSFGIKWDNTTLYNYYLNAAGGWTQIGPQRIPYVSDRYFINTKFTFDVSTQKYSRFQVAPVSFDIKGAGGLVALDATYARMECWGRIYSKATKNAYSYVDSLILTCNDV